MENFFEFLIRSSIAISLFYMLYWLLLRKTTHFKINRLFLTGSLILALVIAIFPVQYEVLIDTPTDQNFIDLGDSISSDTAFGEPEIAEGNEMSIHFWLFCIYFIGVAILMIRLTLQSAKPIQVIFSNQSRRSGKISIYENNSFEMPFSFFNCIFINSDHHKQEELGDILTHEKVHIHERHWIDLLIIELLTVIFWFNPFIWFFELAIKQNHEYLADEGVISRGQTPFRYQALLVNQLMGAQVIGLSNSLNFALGPNRLKMITKQKTPKRKLIRLAWGIPVLAILLVAFAKPNYTENIQQAEEVTKTPLSLSKEKKVTITGKVVTENGEALPGASIVLEGTTIGAVTDLSGKFKFEAPKKGVKSVVASFVGFKTVENSLDISDDEKIFTFDFIMQRKVFGIDPKTMFLEGKMPPPPPPPPAPNFETVEGDVFFIVEEMPKYPGGYYELGQYTKKEHKKLKEKFFFAGKKLEGKAIVGFTVNTKGEVTNIQIKKKSTDIAAEALYLIVKGMENWSPGKQRGKPVSVDYAMELEF